MSYYENGGRRNYFVEFGSGRPVVLLHGITNSGRAWSSQVAPLARAGLRVIVPDHAGHGASAALEQPFGIKDIADDIAALLTSIGIRKADIVGVCLGGLAALEIALTRPELVGKLVVANSLGTMATRDFQTMLEGWAKVLRGPDGPVTILQQSWPLMVNEAFQASGEGLRTYQV
jgi:3-oxoadipate enol-lactonase